MYHDGVDASSLYQYIRCMPTPTEQAYAILADAKTALRAIIERELDAGRYGDVAKVARIAECVAELADYPPEPATPEKAVHGPTPRSAGRSDRTARSSAGRRSPKKSANYPRFERSGDMLVKIGWSKKGRTEYEHRAPCEAARRFAQVLGAAVGDGKTFAMENLLPVQDAAGEELPNYQIYLTLAWLRDLGIVEKKGREGYVLTRPLLDGAAFDRLWNQVPLRA